MYFNPIFKLKVILNLLIKASLKTRTFYVIILIYQGVNKAYLLKKRGINNKTLFYNKNI